MTDPQSLAREYAVIRNDGVVIDRLLLTDLAYEAIDLAVLYPDCELELDADNSKPIGFGAPVLEVPPAPSEPRPPQSLEAAAAMLSPEQRQALLQALTHPIPTAPDQVPAE